MPVITKPVTLPRIRSLLKQTQGTKEVEEVDKGIIRKEDTASVLGSTQKENTGTVSKKAQDILAEEPIDLFLESKAPDIAEGEQEWSERQDEQSDSEGNLENNTDHEDLKMGGTEEENKCQTEDAKNNHPSGTGKENQRGAVFTNELCELLPEYHEMYAESKCTVCPTPVQFNIPSDLLKHLKESHALKIFKCKACDRVTLTHWSIIRHCHKAHQAGRFDCGSCKKSNGKAKVSYVWLHELISHVLDQHPSDSPGRHDMKMIYSSKFHLFMLFL